MWVPQLADPDWVAATLRAHSHLLGFPGPPERVQLVDVRISNPHKPDSPRCHGWATYQVHHGHTRDPGGGALLLLQAGEAGAPPIPHAGTAVPGLPLLVWRFPTDPWLPALATLVDPARARSLLPYEQAGINPAMTTDLRPEVVRYQPGASATVRYRLGTGSTTVGLYAKVLAGVSVEAVDAAHHRLHTASPDLRVAEPLGAEPALGVLWTREVAGGPLLDRLRDGSLAQVDAAAREVAGALAALHGSGVQPSGTTDLAAQVAEAEKKAAKLARACPGLASGVAAVLDAVTAAMAGTRTEGTGSRPLHGDFHVEQFLDSPGGPVLLDLDAMVRGDPEVDLAEFAVDLNMRGLAAETVDRFVGGLFASYARRVGRHPDPVLLRSYAAAEFLNRCYRHLRRPVSGWQQAAAADLGRYPGVIADVESAARNAL